ncbi:MAG: hypothetical protein FWF82_01125 [Oscillospiraceae bacterium]|nr:hypothetical protein [Oscillospiraceae bacterium]
MNQINAGFLKEWFYIWRSFRLGGIIITFIGCALFMPMMCALMMWIGSFEDFDLLATLLSPIASLGLDVYGLESLDSIFDMYSGDSGLLMSYWGGLSMFADTAMLIIIVLLTGTAGGEQKKRSIIIPQTAGLTPSGYVLPKFLFYPTMAFALTMASSFFTNMVCQGVFGMSYSSQVVLITAFLTAVYVAFLVSMYMFLGISLGQPWLAVIYVYIGNGIFATLLPTAFRVDRYTPFNLLGISNTLLLNEKTNNDIYSGIGSHNVFITAGVTIALCVLLAYLALFAVTAKKMDNTADEVY